MIDRRSMLSAIISTALVSPSLAMISPATAQSTNRAERLWTGFSLARHAPERMLWGTDWPHVNLQGPMPDDGDLVDFIGDIVPDEAARRRMLVDNPVEYFGFDALP